jgi:4-hydroxyphenylacetate 3-monooxygenase
MSQTTASTLDRSADVRQVRPFTGAEFLDSLHDSREVWIRGERVKDLTTHPAFRNSARMLARMYDALHDPARQAVLTTGTDTGNGGFTHKFFKVRAAPRNSSPAATLSSNGRAYRTDGWADPLTIRPA